MEEGLLLQSLKIMLLGMGTVFLFLSVMIFLMNLQAKIINRYFVSNAPSSSSSSSNLEQKDKVVLEDKVDDEIVAVITAAVNRFRSRKEKV